MKVAEAVVSFVGDMSGVDAGLGAIPNKAAPVVKKLGDMFSSSISTGIMAGGAAIATLGGFAEALAAPMEKAHVTLQQAIENTGKKWDTYGGQVDAAIKKGEDYNHSATDTQDALTKLVVATQDPAKALADLTLVQNVAAKGNMSLSDAAKQVAMAEVGKGRLFAQNGITLAKSVDTTKLVEKANKDHATAVAGLNTAQQKLSDLEAKDAATGRPLTLAQTQALAAAHQKVSDAQNKVAATAADVTKAQAAGATQTDRVATAMDELRKRTSGFADVQEHTFGGQMDAAKTRLGDFVGMIGGKAAPAMVALGPAMMTAGGLVETGAVGMIGSGAKLIASFVADTAKFVAQQAIRLAAWVAANAVMVATAVATGIAAAVAFLLPLAPFILIGAAVALLVYLVVTHFDQIRAVVTSVVGSIVNFISGAVSNIIGWFGRIAPEVGAALLGILLFVPLLEIRLLVMFAGIVDKIVGFFLSIPGRLLGLGKDILHTIGQAFAGAAANVPVIGGALASFLQSFDQGGIVGGLKGSPQVILAHAGEMVLNDRQQQSVAGGLGGGQTINNYFNAPIDPAAGRRIGRDLAWELKT